MILISSSEVVDFLSEIILQAIVNIEPIIINKIPIIIFKGINSFININASIGDKTGLKKNTREVVLADVSSIALK